MKYNNSNLKLARSLRKNMTPWERKLWYCFLNHYPVKFQRQRMIENFIVDFYCAKAGLIVELDGSGHYDPEAEKNDAIRTLKLEQHGLKVIRFCNIDVDKNFYSVCTVIDKEVKNRTLPQSADADSPLREGAEDCALF